MVKEFTYAMIKPDAVGKKQAGQIIDIIEKKGFDIVYMKKIHMGKADAEEFYDVHKERPFFAECVEFISSGPVVAMVLSKENAILGWRDLMGATNPAEAAEGTIRKQFGESIGNNATHGSDAKETAKKEISQVFPEFQF
jgi:nucleoside-diphosphate kinase